MTLDESIKHCEEVAEEQERKAQCIERQFVGTAIANYQNDCFECAADHRQLAEWLTELKEAREILRSTADFFARVETEKDCFIRVPCEECPLYNEKNDLCRWKYADAVKRLIS